MNIEITIRAPELVQALQAFTEALIGTTIGKEQPQALAPVEAKYETEIKAQDKAVATTATPGTKKEEVSTISLSQIRAKFVEVARKGKREELKALLQDYNADNVSSLNAEVFEDVYARLEAM